MRLKTKLYVWKAFPFGNVLGISNQKFCLNGKRPWCQVWELPQKASSSRLVQNGSTLTKLELVTISSDKLNMLWPSFTLGSDMYYLFFSWHLSYIHTLPWPKTSQAQIWNQNIHSCQYPAGILWPSISFALVLISLHSQPPHLILLSTLTNPIFIFILKISSYNPNFFLFHRIIEPLTSRCSKFRFKPLSTETLEKRLNMISKEENVNCDNKVWKDGLFWKWLKISTCGFNNSAAQIRRLHYFWFKFM